MAETQTTKIGLVQMRCGTDPEKNFSRAIDFIRDAAKKGAGRLVIEYSSLEQLDGILVRLRRK